MIAIAAYLIDNVTVCRNDQQGLDRNGKVIKSSKQMPDPLSLLNWLRYQK